MIEGLHSQSKWKSEIAIISKYKKRTLSNASEVVTEFKATKDSFIIGDYIEELKNPNKVEDESDNYE